MLRRYWLLCIYAILLMTGCVFFFLSLFSVGERGRDDMLLTISFERRFNFLSHGSQGSSERMLCFFLPSFSCMWRN